MANRYQINSRRSRAATRKGRFDLAEEENLAKWIQEITQENRFDLSLFEWLKNGQILCKLVNKIRPKSIKLNKMVAPAKKRENIKNFLNFSQSVGCKKEDMFEPNDLLEEENLAKVVSGLYAFSSTVTKIAPQYAGPTLKLPGIFSGYYQSHFKATGGDLEHIYKRFGVAIPDKAPHTTTVHWMPSIEQRKEAPPSIEQRKEAPRPVSPANFTGYYTSHFKPSIDGFEGIHKRYGVAPRTQIEQQKEGPPRPLSPGNFTGYYTSHFKPSTDGFEGIHKRYGVVPHTQSEQRQEAAPLPSRPKFLPSVGAFNGAAGAFGGIVVPRTMAEQRKEAPPSIEQRKEAPRPVSPGNFTGYYTSHFKSSTDGFEGIHKRYGVAPRTQIEQRKEAPPRPLSPGNFTGYYTSHFKPSTDGFESIHKRYGVVPRTESEQRQEAAPSPSRPKFLPSVGAFNGAAGAFGGIVVPRTMAEQRKEALPPPSSPKFSPSVGSFNGAAGAFGGIRVEKHLVPDEKFRILPSMGTFHGGISKFGGILVN